MSPSSKVARSATACARAACRYAPDGSTPTTRVPGTVSTAEVSAPVPQPASSTASPGRTSAKARNTGASCRLQRPMNRSYASLAENMAHRGAAGLKPRPTAVTLEPLPKPRPTAARSLRLHSHLLDHGRRHRLTHAPVGANRGRRVRNRVDDFETGCHTGED